MICPVCIEKGMTSLISIPTPTIVTPPPTEGLEYWDENDKPHVHNPCHSLRLVFCTNGHEMLITHHVPCPSCDYIGGRTELWTSDTDTVSKYRFTRDKKWKKVVTFDAG